MRNMSDPAEPAPPTLTIGLLLGAEVELLRRFLADLPAVDMPKVAVTNFDLAETRRVCEEHEIACQVFAPAGPFSFARQRNRLFEACRTPWILMLDVDEAITPPHLDAALRLARRPPDRAFVPRHLFMGEAGPLLVDHEPRLLPGDGRFAFEGHVANTLEVEHERGEVLEPANFQITDRGAVWNPARPELRGARFRELARHEGRRLLGIARAKEPSSWCGLGFRHHVMGHDRRAAPYLMAFLRESPGHPTAEYLLARVEERMPQGPESALRRLWRLADSETKDFRVYVALIRLHNERREWDAVCRFAEEACRLFPETAVFHHQLSVARYHLGEREGAMLAHKDALRLYPDFPPARVFARALALAGAEAPA
jgi:hypothetical protein